MHGYEPKLLLKYCAYSKKPVCVRWLARVLHWWNMNKLQSIKFYWQKERQTAWTLCYFHINFTLFSPYFNYYCIVIFFFYFLFWVPYPWNPFQYLCSLNWVVHAIGWCIKMSIDLSYLSNKWNCSIVGWFVQYGI